MQQSRLGGGGGGGKWLLLLSLLAILSISQLATAVAAADDDAGVEASTPTPLASSGDSVNKSVFKRVFGLVKNVFILPSSSSSSPVRVVAESCGSCCSMSNVSRTSGEADVQINITTCTPGCESACAAMDRIRAAAADMRRQILADKLLKTTSETFPEEESLSWRLTKVGLSLLAVLVLVFLFSCIVVACSAKMESLSRQRNRLPPPSIRPFNSTALAPPLPAFAMPSAPPATMSGVYLNMDIIMAASAAGDAATSRSGTNLQLNKSGQLFGNLSSTSLPPAYNEIFTSASRNNLMNTTAVAATAAAAAAATTPSSLSATNERLPTYNSFRQKLRNFTKRK